METFKERQQKKVTKETKKKGTMEGGKKGNKDILGLTGERGLIMKLKNLKNKEGLKEKE